MARKREIVIAPAAFTIPYRGQLEMIIKVRERQASVAAGILGIINTIRTLGEEHLGTADVLTAAEDAYRCAETVGRIGLGLDCALDIGNGTYPGTLAGLGVTPRHPYSQFASFAVSDSTGSYVMATDNFLKPSQQEIAGVFIKGLNPKDTDLHRHLANLANNGVTLGKVTPELLLQY